MAALSCGQTKNCLEESKNRYSTVSKFLLSFEAKGLKQKKLHRGTGINYLFFFTILQSLKAEHTPSEILSQQSRRIRHLHISHNAAYFPFLPHAQKFCISIVFNFSWEGCHTQEKWKTFVEDFFFGGGGGVQIRCIMGNVKVANRLPYPGHTTVFVPRACRFFSAEWLWQRCLAGKDVWHRHVQCTCSEERRLKMELLWARVTMAACREGGSPPMDTLLFILFISKTG